MRPLTGSVVLTLVTAAAAGPASRQEEGHLALLRSPKDMAWALDPEVNGGQRAMVLSRGASSSDRETAMFLWPPGGHVTAHRHTGTICDGVVIEGTIIVTTGCGSLRVQKELPTGSYFLIGGDTVHSLSCRSEGASCRIFWSQPNKAKRAAVELSSDGNCEDVGRKSQ